MGFIVLFWKERIVIPGFGTELGKLLGFSDFRWDGMVQFDIAAYFRFHCCIFFSIGKFMPKSIGDEVGKLGGRGPGGTGEWRM